MTQAEESIEAFQQNRYDKEAMKRFIATGFPEDSLAAAFGAATAAIDEPDTKGVRPFTLTFADGSTFQGSIGVPEYDSPKPRRRAWLDRHPRVDAVIDRIVETDEPPTWFMVAFLFPIYALVTFGVLAGFKVGAEWIGAVLTVMLCWMIFSRGEWFKGVADGQRAWLKHRRSIDDAQSTDG